MLVSISLLGVLKVWGPRLTAAVLPWLVRGVLLMGWMPWSMRRSQSAERRFMSKATPSIPSVRWGKSLRIWISFWVNRLASVCPGSSRISANSVMRSCGGVPVRRRLPHSSSSPFLRRAWDGRRGRSDGWACVRASRVGVLESRKCKGCRQAATIWVGSGRLMEPLLGSSRSMKRAASRLTPVAAFANG